MKTLPKNNVDVALDYVIKAGILAWLVKITFRSDRA